MDEFFPLDGAERSWVMENMDSPQDFLLDVTFDGERQVLEDDSEVYTFSTAKRCIDGVDDCGAGPLYDITMSSAPLVGVRLHGYTLAGEEPVVFNNPLVLADDKMVRGDVVTTEDVDGHSFTVTFVGLEAELDDDGEPTGLADELGCDHTMGVIWKCAHLSVESTPAGHWLAGDYWATAGYNIVAFKRVDDPGKWRTIDVEYVP